MCTGWRRPIGCLKLQVNFRRRATNYKALLRKMTSKDKASYASSAPCKRESGDHWCVAACCSVLQCIAGCCGVMQGVILLCVMWKRESGDHSASSQDNAQITATHCNTLQHTATHCCNTLLQHNTPPYNTLQPAELMSTLPGLRSR